MPNVERAASLHDGIRSGVGVRKEGQERGGVHVVVLDGKFLVRAALVGRVIRWVGQV